MIFRIHLADYEKKKRGKIIIKSQKNDIRFEPK